MRFTFLIQLTCLIFILTGCQALNPTPNPKQALQEAPQASPLHANEGAQSKPPQDTNYTQKNQHHRHKQDDAQTKIDQALELCTLAQNMWEEGRLEDAIANLDDAYYLILEIESDADFEVAQQKEDIRFLISKRILEIYASRQVVVKGKHNEIPIPMNDHVKREIKRLTGPEKRYLILSIQRSHKYRPFIIKELQKAGLPEELSWLPLIESGFKLRALSHARALGLWQFIPSTGHKFGLKRNYYVDERMDPEKSTLAAISYLKELHNLFGDWATVLAAYNCGEGRVLKTIRRQRINYLDNFWDLYQNLPRETARYVPRFFATLHIVKNLDSYGIKLKTPTPPLSYKTVSIKKQVLLKDISKSLKIKTSVLKNLNPELRYGLLPPETYALKVPEENAKDLSLKIAQIKSTYSPPPMFVYHRVRRGDTLSGIARKYKSSVRAISRANGISRSHRIIAGKVIKIPSRQGGVSTRTISSSTSKPRRSQFKYKVKQGDNLWIIARKFSTTTKSLMKINKLKTTNLKIGQILIVRSNKSAKASQGTYQVQSGDSPFLIAKKHNMSLNRLLALNRLNKTSKIYPGQKLIVE